MSQTQTVPPAVPEKTRTRKAPRIPVEIAAEVAAVLAVGLLSLAC